jgi:hypothetical protein
MLLRVLWRERERGKRNGQPTIFAEQTNKNRRNLFKNV